jgi:hypothetical protein
LNFNEFDDNERHRKFLLQFNYLKLVQFTIGHFIFAAYQMKTIFECKNISCDYECLQGLNGGKNCVEILHSDDADDKANGIRFAFYLFISLRDGKFFDISHLVKSSLQQHLMHFS